MLLRVKLLRNRGFQELPAIRTGCYLVRRPREARGKQCPTRLSLIVSEPLCQNLLFGGTPPLCCLGFQLAQVVEHTRMKAPPRELNMSTILQTDSHQRLFTAEAEYFCPVASGVPRRRESGRCLVLTLLWGIRQHVGGLQSNGGSLPHI